MIVGELNGLAGGQRSKWAGGTAGDFYYRWLQAVAAGRGTYIL